MKPPSLFRMVPSPTPYDLPFLQNGGLHMPQRYANGHISATATGDPIHFMFSSRTPFSGSAERVDGTPPLFLPKFEGVPLA